ncbi:phosphatase PAP2 family protein [Nodosilinea sp. LEGE 07298]|uniref:phosphatase PAP2 family protein n=1 Tax=Nodosilinea sp. LEGE 07298 TaxID=2777970 RepID=UPI00187F2FAC|nr:phosphatase PAP2 family protein [Nodosilinea sp. LEGE 07298]MBE9110091.1 phosphatase PAP2 family protein [Nodosilinea sp. LEGE 07298]
MARWTTAQVLKRGWYQFWQDSRQVPQKVWRRWAGTLAIGLGLCALITLALTVGVKLHTDQGLQAWDARMLPVLADRLPLSFSRSITWESPGNLLGILPVVCVFVGIMVARSRPLLAATMIVAYVLQFALVWIGWGYWNRDRPDLIANGVAASGLHSFPSGHAVVVITVYGLLGYLWCRASRSWVEKLLITVAIAGWIGLIVSSRLELGAHWPSDVVVGVIIGLLWLATVIVALKRVEEAL